MPAPAFGTAATASSGTGTAITVNKPGSLANGDVVLACFASSENATSTGPAGFTECVDFQHAPDGDPSVHVYSKVITDAAGEPASWAFTISTTSKWAASSIRITGAHQTTPVVVVGAGASGSGTVATATAITPGVADCLLVMAAVTNADGTWSGWTGALTERVDAPSPAGGNAATRCAIGVATETLSASTSTGTRDATASVNQRWVAVLLAVRPPPSTSLPYPRWRRGQHMLVR